MKAPAAKRVRAARAAQTAAKRAALKRVHRDPTQDPAAAAVQAAAVPSRIPVQAVPVVQAALVNLIQAAAEACWEAATDLPLHPMRCAL